ncbi:hypothetical protein Pmani_039282 [Petrolisthes manimaculis]|uniref:Uncharacterized protein n=1 Tax=Petrolisthes manimaculis TaxID=1843537 RepID=A0AAE1NEI7_9EUCA|nr:hypothetical protein Pmani_039282 [Petrolisthes manimaculis]
MSRGYESNRRGERMGWKDHVWSNRGDEEDDAWSSGRSRRGKEKVMRRSGANQQRVVLKKERGQRTGVEEWSKTG